MPRRLLFANRFAQDTAPLVRSRRRPRTVMAWMIVGAASMLFAGAASSSLLAQNDQSTGEGAEERVTGSKDALEALKGQMSLSEARQRQLEAEIAALEQDRTALTETLLRTTNRISTLEARIVESERRLDALLENEMWIRRSLAARRGTLAEILAALQRIGQNPPPALVVNPDSALDAVRSAILLSSVMPDIQVEAEALAADLEALRELRADIEIERARLETDVVRLQDERVRVEVLIAEKRARRDQQTDLLEQERQKAEQLAERAGSLEELIGDLERELDSARAAAEAARTAAAGTAAPAGDNLARLSPSAPFPTLQATLPYPVQGTVVRRFGEEDTSGERTAGLSIATLPQAQVTAPADGWVVYAGPFRSYGDIVIMNMGSDYHILLAGMDTMSVDLGQFVLAGEPIGRMGSERLASAVTLDLNASRPILYVEFRYNGAPLDPDPWWARNRDSEVRG